MVFQLADERLQNLCVNQGSFVTNWASIIYISFSLRVSLREKGASVPILEDSEVFL